MDPHNLGIFDGVIWKRLRQAVSSGVGWVGGGGEGRQGGGGGGGGES